MSLSDSNAPSTAASDLPNRAVEIWNADGTGNVLVLCEHASNHIPARYDGLGLSADDRASHAAWDPGALAVAKGLSAALDSPLVASRVSRLVYDCNRPPEAPSAMPAKSELIDVPGNCNLDAAMREERVRSVYLPFCDAVAKVISDRKAAGRETVLVTIHSFTPVYYGTSRSVEIGILHDDDSRLADAMLNAASALPHRQIDRNEPYGPQDGVTHSLVLHGQNNRLANVMIEVRNDLLQTPEQEAAMTEELLSLLRPALQDIAAKGGIHA
ncbi:N-formylglutamate amidohydrolase [Phaeobacter porticola]|uniref:Putative N-formylglutamate amidohydrolase n=1 Tax=Phaeobacter porticola TaxID=1844006 RepID=A0A1L3I7B3_9RHOB|nr:N-formylglutamate amidohydrolase [Phaeobacter porticola]APG48038.1 putative N-formylglutamate amidohydrolase [Phaeobacter porticola]